MEKIIFAALQLLSIRGGSGLGQPMGRVESS